MEKSFPIRKMSQNCDLFEYKKNKSNLAPNEDLLKLYMNDLNKIYNQSFSTNAIADILMSNSSNRTSQPIPNKFKLCKEKAFDYLQKSEQINSYLEIKTFGAESKYISEKEIKNLVDNQHVKVHTEFTNLVNLYKKFELNFAESQHGRLENFVSSGFVELKSNINQILDFLSSSDNQLTENDCCKNLMIYGPPGSSISLFLESILKTRLKNIKSQKESCECYIKILKVNFELLINQMESVDLNFIENLISSLIFYKTKHRVNVFLILENIEFLFETEFFKAHRIRFLGDLLYELGIQDKTLDSIQSNRLFFTILSERPWSLPSALIQQFGKKVFCGIASAQDVKIICKQGVKNLEKKLKKNWLFENFEDFSRKEYLLELTCRAAEPFVLTEKLLKELFPLLGDFLTQILEQMLNKNLDKKELNLDAFNSYRKKTEISSWFKEKTSMRFAAKFSLRKYSLVNRKKSSILQTKKDEMFEMLKYDLWNSESNLIRNKILEFCLSYFENNQISHDLENTYKQFKIKYKHY